MRRMGKSVKWEKEGEDERRKPEDRNRQTSQKEANESWGSK